MARAAPLVRFLVATPRDPKSALAPHRPSLLAAENVA